MSLHGQIVRIVVAEPFEWDHGNLFGTIFSDRGGIKLKIKLTKTIKGKLFSSDIIELRPRFKDESFKPLTQIIQLQSTVDSSKKIQPILTL